MTVSEFKQQLDLEEVPGHLSVYLRSLWFDAKGEWKGAHDLVDQLPGEDAAYVHAYLHRKEGDQSNADYWYRRSGRPRSQVSLEKEWEELVSYFLTK
ncbi:hypothetical protein [Lunatibacter salilacus]|uniref:hypothetical protein n=1 Tax=Lunatibacter salilacus TaxID=2483804 RepID=UPI00131A8F0F|nr:hypothetical protein [Lunatibacter salilacus]